MQYKFKHSTFWPLYPKLWRLQKSFEKKISKLRGISNIDEKLEIATQIAGSCACAPNGYFSNYELEKVFLDASNHLPDVHCQPQPNSFLHVVTASSPTGGHVNVMGRWISSAPKNEKHSIMVLDQSVFENEFPMWLVEDGMIAHAGEYIELHENDILKRAYKLREKAADYSKIILYTGNNDGTPLIAFGTSSFTNPVIYFNHSDHLFWLGISIADIVADISYNDYTLKRRKAHKPFFLGIPPQSVKDDKSIISKEQARKELGIPLDAFVMVTCGRPIKYKPINRNSLARQFEKISKMTGAICYAIGPDNTISDWQEANINSGDRVSPLGLVTNRELYDRYLYAADLYVGSYPLGGYTALMDGVQHGLPFLCLNISKQFCYGIDADNGEGVCWCNSTKELEHKMLCAIRDKSFLSRLWQASLSLYKNYCDYDAWCERRNKLYVECPEVHSVYPFENIKGEDTYIDDYVAHKAITMGVGYGKYKIIRKVCKWLIRF